MNDRLKESIDRVNERYGETLQYLADGPEDQFEHKSWNWSIHKTPGPCDHKLIEKRYESPLPNPSPENPPEPYRMSHKDFDHTDVIDGLVMLVVLVLGLIGVLVMIGG